MSSSFISSWCKLRPDLKLLDRVSLYIYQIALESGIKLEPTEIYFYDLILNVRVTIGHLHRLFQQMPINIYVNLHSLILIDFRLVTEVRLLRVNGRPTGFSGSSAHCWIFKLSTSPPIQKLNYFAEMFFFSNYHSVFEESRVHFPYHYIHH